MTTLVYLRLAGKPFGCAGDLAAETAACLEEANLEHHAADFSREIYQEVMLLGAASF